ncbi:hypothetical protein MRX96_012111 [Rhipicephalus microplus]
MTSSATTGGTDSASLDGAGTCQLPTTAPPDDLSVPGDPCPSSPHTGLPLSATSPQGVESTLPAPAAEGTTESPDNPPPDASAAMEVVKEVLTSTAARGNTRKEAPHTAKDFLLTLSAGATPTNHRKKGKKKPTKKQPPVTASEDTAANLPQPFGKAPHCSGHHKEAQQCSEESPQTQRVSGWSLPEVPDAVPGTLLLLRPSWSTLPLWAQSSSGRRPPEVPSVNPHA